MVASTGGHLAQLVKLAEASPPSNQSVWVTFDTAQSRSLLAGKRVEYVPYIKPRGAASLLKAQRQIRRVMQERDFEHVVSTGAGLALAALPYAAARSIAATYVESVSRTQGPSLTGRIVAKIPRVRCFTQHSAWSNERWTLGASVFRSYKAEAVREATPRPRIFVTLGTIEGYRFDSLVDTLVEQGIASASTTWQLGYTSRTDLPGTVFDEVPSATFDDLVREADLVITHAGVGTIMHLLDRGEFPVVIPRRADRREHVDDHQLQICTLLRDRRIACVLEVDEISSTALHDATRYNVVPG